jgi:tetratricopeptide (TPR) repeat protein
VRIEGGRGLWGTVLIALLSTTTGVHAQGCEPWVAKIVSVQGPVEVEPSGGPHARPVGLDDPVCPGDRVRVGPLGRAAVQLADEAETLVRLDEGTTLTFPAPQVEKSLLLKLIKGVVHVLSRIPHALTIETPMVSAGIEGTEFVLGVSRSEAELWVFEGEVRYWNPQGQLQVGSGEGALARPGQAPVRRVVVKPREAVEWALYYPPLVDPRPESYPPALRATLSAYRANDLPAAFAALERVPAGDRDGRYLLLRAGLLLSVGRVAKAEADLAEAARADPESGGASALRSVIALVRDQKDEALRLAESGAKLDPDSPLPQAALSYAHQGRFEIEKALGHARRAVELAPEDALLWARVSELELSRGDLDAALEAAKTAETLSPALARTQTVLGFAYLTRIEVDKAKSAFERAIQGDPADPLPRLGMGLAKIRDGDLDEGTREIETAASLDPNTSLVRSYLGKAYYEQKRDGLASSEYEQAKLLDPKDPTPWFYDAIQKQTTNRPVEALHDLERATALNDNRAVYRSKLLLDQDLAARSAALGRIYRDLGFGQLALVKGWNSVNSDPSDYSGHRLLADSYSALPRHEIARVSEVLQSQLLQPLNLTPVQPSLAENNLLVLEGSGPSELAFNEFNPLMTGNRFALQTSGGVGSHNTFTDEVAHSGIWNQLSYSIGQFRFETDGFRENNDLKHDIYNAFVQASVSPSVSVQAEYRHTDTKHGNRTLEFVPPPILPFRSDGLQTFLSQRDTFRIGLHYSPAPGADLIATASHQDTIEEQTFDFFSTRDERRGFGGEAQYLYGTEQLKAVLGGGYYDLGSTVGAVVARTAPFLPERTRHGNGYLYTYYRFPDNVRWTLGASVDALDEAGQGPYDKINPKIGITWDLIPDTTLRLAVFKVLKRSLIADQTVEPTQVAGFNQFFDDANGTQSTRFGLALDHRFTLSVYGGIEVSKRHMTVPFTQNAERSFVDWEEELYRWYLYWTPHPYLSFSLEYEIEDFERIHQAFRTGLPPNTETHVAPAAVSFFHPSGVFARFGITFVNQEVELRPEQSTLDDRDDFVVTNALVGYRLPKRFGLITLEARNLFDTEFNFQGSDVRLSSQRRASPPLFEPEQSLFAQFTLAF